jgi:hypothetical protein
VGPAKDLAHSPGSGQGYAERSQKAGVKKPDGKEPARPDTLGGGQKRHNGFGGLLGVFNGNGRLMVVKGRCRHNDDERGHYTGEERADQSLQRPVFNVVYVETLIHDGALLKKSIQGAIVVPILARIMKIRSMFRPPKSG